MALMVGYYHLSSIAAPLTKCTLNIREQVSPKEAHAEKMWLWSRKLFPETTPSREPLPQLESLVIVWISS